MFRSCRYRDVNVSHKPTPGEGGREGGKEGDGDKNPGVFQIKSWMCFVFLNSSLDFTAWLLKVSFPESRLVLQKRCNRARRDTNDSTACVCLSPQSPSPLRSYSTARSIKQAHTASGRSFHSKSFAEENLQISGWKSAWVKYNSELLLLYLHITLYFIFVPKYCASYFATFCLMAWD